VELLIDCKFDLVCLFDRSSAGHNPPKVSDSVGPSALMERFESEWPGVALPAVTLSLKYSTVAKVSILDSKHIYFPGRWQEKSG